MDHRYPNLPVLLILIIFIANCGPEPTPPGPCLPSIAKADDYHPDNFFFKAIPENASIASHSDIQIATLVNENPNGARISVNDYGESIYYANNSTNRFTLWENNSKCYNGVREGILDVPLPNGAKPSPGLDESMTVIDTDNELVYSFFNVRTPASSCYWYCREYSGAVVAPLRNTGVVSLNDNPNSGTTGSGFLTMAGVIWPHELNNGEINHALRGSYKLTSTNFVSPAIKSDGTHSEDDALPMGALLQLDPSIDLDAVNWGMTADEKVIAKAMQKFGIYISDTNGNGLSLKGVAIQSFSCNPYRNYKNGIYNSGGCTNVKTGSIQLKNIPLSALRVIDFPHGTVDITFDVSNSTSKICCGFDGCSGNCGN